MRLLLSKAKNNMKEIIEEAWENRELLNHTETKNAIREVINQIDLGNLRCAEPTENGWQVNEWVKKAVVLYFPIQEMNTIEVGPFEFHDKIPLKKGYKAKGVRVVPHAIARHGSYVAKGVIMMPSYVNIGAYVDSGTMVDTWATVGSCAQIGKNVHISGGAGIGGVLEPIQAGPVIIEDDCLIGARSEVAEGVVIEKGAVLSMGVFIGASTKVIDRNTGEIYMGRVPAYSVVVPGSLPGKLLPDGSQGPSLYCAVIVKKVDAQTRSKTSVNELLRD